jgi:DNA-binding XRE family transcriptional regulator
MATKITGAQVRAARAFLRWTVAELADNAGVGISTVQKIEEDKPPKPGLDTTRDYRRAARNESLDKIAKALTKARITFLPDDGKAGPGVRWRGSRRPSPIVGSTQIRTTGLPSRARSTASTFTAFGRSTVGTGGSKASVITDPSSKVRVR